MFAGRLIFRLAICFFVLVTVPVLSVSDQTNWRKELLAWRAQHAAELQKPDGWLSLAGLEWLQPGDNSFGSASDNRIRLSASAPPHLGILHLEKDAVTLAPLAGGFPQDFLVGGKPAEPQPLPVDANQDKLSPRLTIGTFTMYVIRRGARFALRIKDSHSATLMNFHGLSWFPPNPRYRVTARWIPFVPPKTVTLVTVIGTSYEQPVPGAAAFTLGGIAFQIVPVLEDPKEAKLFFILRDTTSASTTYKACRFLYTGFPTNGLAKPGKLVLDFNHLENPPCAYTPYSTCPLPPENNRLPIALSAGEKRYHD